MLDFIGGALGAIGNIAGSIIGSNASRDNTNATNATNIDLSRENRDWIGNMSNTAHQREVADLRAAGLNPILSVNSGASTPQPNAPQVQANGVSPLAEGIKATGSSALGVLRTMKDFDQQEAQVNATKAAGLLSVEQAKAAGASAEQSRMNTKLMTERLKTAGIEAESRGARAKADKMQAEFDQQMNTYDNYSKRILEGLGGITDAFSLRNLIQGMRHRNRNQTIREEQHLRNQGMDGSSLP